MAFFNKNPKSEAIPDRQTIRKPDLPVEPKGGTALAVQEETPSGPDAWVGKTVPVFQIGETILDKYKVTDVKSGAMGNVYIVQDTSDQQMLAIKAPNEMMLSHPDFFARVLREADAWIGLGVHPHIAFCYYIQKIEEVPHIFIEYVDGGNLEDWIANLRCYDLKISLDMAIQFCHGMEHAHKYGLIHRDIKPKNILVTKGGILKVTDFGIARKDDAEEGEKKQAQTIWKKDLTSLDAMGTYDYMPPEQFEDPHGVDARADIFAFGVCLYEMICGRRPYDETSIEAKAKGTSSWEPVKLREDIPEVLADLLKRCVALEKEGRYSSFVELREALITIYQTLFAEVPLHATVKITEARADILNNRGVSYWNLGNEAEARKCWEEALKYDQQHLDTTANLGHLRWDIEEISGMEYLTMLKGLEVPKGTLPEYWHYLVGYYLEIGNKEEITKIQQSSYWSREGNLSAVLESLHQSQNKIFTGHANKVNSVSFSPDGRYALSGSDDGTLRLWDITNGECLRIFKEIKENVISVSFSLDSCCALSAYKAGLYIFELANDYYYLGGYIEDTNSVSFSPDGCYALLGSGEDCDDISFRLWEMRNINRCLQVFRGHIGKVISVSFSPDGCYALSGSKDKTMRVWDTANGECFQVFAGHTEEVTSVSFSPDKHYALSGSSDKTLRLWEIASGKCLWIFIGHSEGVSSVSFSPDGLYVLSGSNDRTLRLWEVKNSKCIRIFKGHTDSINSVSFSFDGLYAISGSMDKTVRLWDLDYYKKLVYRWQPYLSKTMNLEQISENQKRFLVLLTQSQVDFAAKHYQNAYQSLRQAQEITGYEKEPLLLNLLTEIGLSGGNRVGLSNTWQKKVYIHKQGIHFIVFSPDGLYNLSNGHMETFQLCEVASGECLRVFEGHTDIVINAGFMLDGLHVLSISRDKTIRLWEAMSGKCLRVFKVNLEYILSASFSLDGRYALLGSLQQPIQLWDIVSEECLQVFKGHSEVVYKVSFSPDVQYALSITNMLFRLWEIASGECLWSKETTSDSVICFSPDGRYALSGLNSTLRLWEVASGKEIRVFQGHTDFVDSVAFSPDGRYALSGSSDKTLRLWEIASGREVRVIQGHTNVVNSVAFSPDGRFVLSGSSDKTIRLWEFDWEWEFDDNEQ